MKALVTNITENREAWLEARKGKISSSNIAIVAGQNQYKSRLELWLEFTGKRVDTFEGNDFTDLGIALEPFVGKLFAKKYGLQVEPANALYQHPNFDWAVASPDDLVYRDGALDGICEIKTATERSLHKWLDDACPTAYQIQLMWQMGVCGIQRGWVAGLVGGDPRNFFTPAFAYDDSVFDQLLEMGARFLDMVASDTPPNPGPGDSKLITALLGEPGSAVVQLDDDTTAELIPHVEAIQNLQAVKKGLNAELKERDEELKAHQNFIRMRMGDAGAAILADGTAIKLCSVNVGEKIVAPYSYVRMTVKTK